MRKIGFTGTQQGMTRAQAEQVGKLFALLGRADEVHHGDCVGADSQFHGLALESSCKIFVHPPESKRKRALCSGPLDRVFFRLPKPYLERNHDIVDETEMLIATPKEAEEELRSGTWATVRYARKLGRPIMIVLPDGGYRTENEGRTA